MDDEEFKHKLQENQDWQLYQQLMTLPKQKAADQIPVREQKRTSLIAPFLRVKKCLTS